MPPAGGEAAAPSMDDLFAEFWKAYPRKVGKDAARKAFEKRKPDRALLDLMLVAVAAQQKGRDWTKDGGQFIPHPSTWLNQGRWMDELPERAVGAGQSVDAAGNAVPVTSQRRDFSGVDYGEGTRDEDLPDFLREGLEGACRG